MHAFFHTLVLSAAVGFTKVAAHGYDKKPSAACHWTRPLFVLFEHLATAMVSLRIVDLWLHTPLLSRLIYLLSRVFTSSTSMLYKRLASFGCFDSKSRLAIEPSKPCVRQTEVWFKVQFVDHELWYLHWNMLLQWQGRPFWSHNYRK